ncbi:MAG: PD-(D/E)XK nuclease family protein [Oscillospiraceae bacterium]|nr:PD-(D/E)XK nuclease family protein [Oscillospiraceae bacterium]
MLRIIHSLHSGGRSECLQRVVAEFIKTSDKRVKPIYIVPEQAHFETERELYYYLGARNINDITITTFSKLSAEIVATFAEPKLYCDDTVKLVTMMKCINALKPQFVFYTGRVDAKNFAAKTLSLIESFKREGITPDELNQRAQPFGEMPGGYKLLNKKMRDISLIYSEYTKDLDQNFADKLDDILRAANLTLNQSNYFSKRRVFIDGFDSFSGSQRKLLGSIIRQSDEVAVALGLDKYPTNNPDYRFAAITAKQLIALCDDVGKKHEIILAIAPTRQEQSVDLVSAPDVYAECDYIAAKIRDLVDDGECCYNDIAVLIPSGAASATTELVTAFKRYDVPVFADLPSAIPEKPIIRFMLTVLEAATFSANSVAMYIKSGFVRVPSSLENTAVRSRGKLTLKKFSHNEAFAFLERKQRTVRLGRRSINELDSLAEAYNIRGNDWEKSFPQTAEGLRAEPLRSEITQKLRAFSQRLKAAKTGDKMTEVLAEFLIDELELGRTVLAIVNRRNAEFKKGFQLDKSLSDEYRQLWDIMVTVLESMHSALVDFPIKLKDYIEILSRALSNTDIARPPQVLDAVIVGDIERTRTRNIKATFIMGATSGVFPGGVRQDDFFKADELESLVEMGIELSDNRQGRVERRNYQASKAMASGAQRLIITCPQNSLSYETLEPSPLFRQLSEELNTKGRQIIKTADLPIEFFIRNLKTLKYAAARSPKDKRLLAAIKKHEPQFVERLSHNYDNEHEISSHVATQLIGKRPESPTSLGFLSNCPFCYFCRYGLAVFPRAKGNSEEPESFLKGSLIHSCIEKLTTDFDSFLKLSSQDITEKTKRAVELFIESLPYNEYTKKQTKYLLGLQVDEIVKMLCLLQGEFKGSFFKVISSEHPFSYNIGNITVKGRIDRVDVCENGGNDLLRVVDYKSGKARFDWDSVCYGMNLQILLYLFAVEKQGEPSGAYIKNTGGTNSKPAVFSQSLEPSEQDIFKNQLDGRRMSGIQLNGDVGAKEVERLKSHFQELTGTARTQYVAAKMLTNEEYEELKNYVGTKLTEQKETLLNGKIPALPVQKDKNRENGPCAYCDYRCFCGNDGQMAVDN